MQSEAASRADFSTIRYGQVWEDADVLLAGLDVQPGDVCLLIVLAGDNALEKNFTLVAGGAADGIEYVDATPKSSESQFTRIRLGFVDNLPRRMELTDAFGQSTELTFSDVRPNPKVAADTFVFTPPKGAGRWRTFSEFTQIMPVSSASVKRSARVTSDVQT